MSIQGETITVRFLTDRPAEDVLVRLLPITSFRELQRDSKDEGRCAALFVGKDMAWVQTLHPLSAEKIIVSGWKLNRDALTRHATRQMENASAQASLVLAFINGMTPQIRRLFPEAIAQYEAKAAEIIKEEFPNEQQLIREVSQ